MEALGRCPGDWMSQSDQASRRVPRANAFLTSDCEIPNFLAIAEGLTPALKAARTAFCLPAVNEPAPSSASCRCCGLASGTAFSFARLGGRAATLGLGGDSRKQCIDFHINQCSGQVLRQEMALLRGQAVRPGFVLWNSRRPGRRYGR